jgi:hypothetical protein
MARTTNPASGRECDPQEFNVIPQHGIFSIVCCSWFLQMLTEPSQRRAVASADAALQQCPNRGDIHVQGERECREP